jgi:hypothetical protein
MAGNTENIEAKLAAYIDGDLDAQGRAEIEKHLAANPQHRTLIEQLSKQRDLLRELPREEAPEDILEALQNQMERSVLLGDDDAGEPSEHLKISRWPQRFAVAAIVLLTVGLGAIIYFVLPRGNGAGDYAVATQRGATLEREGASTVSSSISDSEEAKLKTMSDVDAVASSALPSKSGAGERESSAMKRAAGTEDGGAPVGEKAEIAKADVFSPKTAANRGFVGGGGGAAGSSVAFEDLRAAQALAQNSAIARQLKDTSGLDDNALVVVVNSADPSGAQSQVTRYLESNKIAWDEVTRPMPGPLEMAQSQVVHLDRAQQSQVPQMKTGERRVETKGGALAEQADKTAAATPPGPPAAAAAAPAATPAPSAPAAPQQQQQQQQDQQARTQAPAGVANAGRDLSKSYEPLSNAVSADAGLEEATARERMKEQAQQKPLQQQEPARAEAQQQQAAPAQQSVEGPQVQQRVADQRVIIARGVTRRQAQELSSNLSKQQAIQRADLYDPQGATADAYQRARNLGAPTSQPTVRAGGVEAGQQLAGAPATAPAEDESLRLSGTAARKAPDAPSGILPSTQPADTAGALAAATPLPATKPLAGPTTAPAPALAPLADGRAFDFAGDAAATQPTTAATGVEERVDVVILVNDDAAVLQQPMPNAPAQPQQQQLDASQEPAPPATTAESAPTTQPSF